MKVFGPAAIFGAATGGSPPRLLALHGWGRSHRDFDQVVTGLDAVSLDLPGFGATPPPDEAWGGHDYAEAVAGVIEELGPPLVVVGHSFGGRVATCLAADHPEMVSALLLTGVPLIRRSPSRPSAKYRLARRLNKAGLISDERIERARQRHGSADYKAATGVMRDILVRAVNESYEAELAQIACPVELLWGAADTAAPVGQAEEAVKLIRDGHLEVLDECDHETLLRRPDSVRQKCLDLLDRVGQ